MSGRRRIHVIAFVFAFVALATLPCLAGQTVTKQAEFKNFTEVEAGSAFVVTITRSDSYSAVVHVAKELMPCVKMKQEGDKLKLRLKEGCCSCNCGCDDDCMRAEITMPRLSALRLHGAAQVRLVGFTTPADLRLRMSGASVVKGDYTAKKARFKLSGASVIDLDGSADVVELDANGACHIKLADFPVRDFEADLNGATKATVKATRSLDAECNGVSILKYLGEPEQKRIHTSGMSSIMKG
jgi:hypothetical protein